MTARNSAKFERVNGKAMGFLNWLKGGGSKDDTDKAPKSSPKPKPRPKK